jgi:dTDP-4-amino-4,6-dideoxygalactose transaminase
MLLDHGRLGKKYEHEVIGTNQRMDELQAAILGVKLKTLAEGNAARRRLAAVYQRELRESGLQLMQPTPDAEPVYHHLTVQLERREETAARLAQEGIGTAMHYPIPLHLQPALRGLALGSFPIAERIARRTLSLPLYPELSEDQVVFICDALRASV